MPHFNYFANASLLVSRPAGERTARGYEQTGADQVLQCRCDAQESGRSLERAQQLYETGDVLVFCQKDVIHAQPGDIAQIDMDDGRQLDGSVEEVMPLDRSILISL